MPCKAMNPAQARKGISLVVFVLFILLFGGGEKISVFLSAILLPLQLAPALLSVITNPTALFIGGLIILFAVSLIFGRVYCSFLCPLGIMQDCFIFASRVTGFRRKHSWQRPYNKIRYSLLLLTMLSAAAGFMALFSFLDPFSVFGRITTHLLDPVLVHLYNACAGILNFFDIFPFTRDISPIPVLLRIITIVYLIVLAIMSFRYGRLYCNTICPAGALLGLIARFSLFKLTIADRHCTDCRLCESVCKAGCIDSSKMTIDQSRCINCFNCLNICSRSAISYQSSLQSHLHQNWSPARRSFIFGTIAAAGSLALILNSGIRNIVAQAPGKKENIPVAPPGSGSVDHFTKFCSACHQCVSVCPTKVLTPSLLSFGIGGFMQPEMDYQKSFCDYECNACSQVCPTGAIRPLELAEKKFTQIGKADLIRERCIVYINNENCGACGEVCPTHTIYFVNKNNILYPETETKYCIGCGACQKACPTEPKSIIVISSLVHQKAAQFHDLPEQVPPVKKQGSDKDFPF